MVLVLMSSINVAVMFTLSLLRTERQRKPKRYKGKKIHIIYVCHLWWLLSTGLCSYIDWCKFMFHGSVLHLFLSLWIGRQYTAPQCWYISTRWHWITSRMEYSHHNKTWNETAPSVWLLAILYTQSPKTCKLKPIG